MLQQTRVAVVIPYYERFLARFPTVQALAEATGDEVLALWSGLGYYGRARRLHAAAQKIVAEHGGRFPRRLDAVRELPGVGRYTAGAVTSIAFGEPAPVVDGNVARVLVRLRALRGDLKSSAVVRRLWDEAGGLLDPARPGDFNQALMELGATVCLPSLPDCARCPVEGECAARAAGLENKLPRAAPRRPGRAEEGAVLVLRERGRCLVVKRPERGQLRGLWELPGDGGGGDPRLLATALRRRYGFRVEVGKKLGQVRHAILDRRVRLGVFRGMLLEPPSRSAVRSGWRWVRPTDALAGQVPLSAATRKVLVLLGSTASS